jgi:histidinol dehydrogenase
VTAISLAVRGSASSLTSAERKVLFNRATSSNDTIRADTAAIVQRVRDGGDDALRALALGFDKVALKTLEVPREQWRSALASLDPKLRRALERAAQNIRAAHEAFRPMNREFTTADGVTIGRRADPLRRVGVYAPGGRATYPSSLLMGAVPARVAGVGEVIVCSPPGPGGTPSPVLLAAAELAGVDRVFALGGAGAIAAMAYGTATVPRADRIVGPGNAWVAEAKLQVAGVVAIDAPAGPSELLVIADDSADAATVVRELIAQAEHDPMAAVVLVTTSKALARQVEEQLVAAVAGAGREAIVRQSLEQRGAIVVVPTLEAALDFAAEFSAEHVLVICEDSGAVAGRVRNAGTVFVGDSSSVAFGDYMTGANHVLPTGGLARSYSGLSTIDFYRWTTWQQVSRSAAAALADDVAALADAEGLPAHAVAAHYWLERPA